ncbi:MAG: aromatic ring-hydroxylating dioxygenase subunit alpha [Deltaproteobacteria bacterium]|nr:MAG: aromatic ring-hydroxylating dioxygenase subunit alpha [Deltaproteobacteria bacterium]
MRVNAPIPPRIRDAWYVLAWSHEVGRKPIVRKLYGEPITLFRASNGEVGALVDRCPHRGVPLSGGVVVGDRLQCPYHGWEFTCSGRCEAIPSFLGDPDHVGRRAQAHAVREQQGVVWVWGRAGAEPTEEPFHFEYAGRAGYTEIRHDVQADATVHAVAENALDVPHTAYLHGGLFRNADVRNRITAEVRRWHDHVECEYIGEPRPTGIVARILSPSGGIVTHYDRFFLPSIVQVEYRIGDENHFVITAAGTPADDYDTRLYAVVALKSRIPGFVFRVLKPLGLRVFAQDAVILAQQTENTHRFGEEVYASTEVDLIGPHILKLMRRAERGDLGPQKAEPWTRSVEMDV